MLSLRQLAYLIPHSWCLGAWVLTAGCGGNDAEFTMDNLMDRPVDPAGYQVEIDVLETRLFARGPLGSADREILVMNLRHLSTEIDKVVKAPVSKMANAEVRVLAERIEMGLDRPNAVREWIRIRGNVFYDAPWYRWRIGEEPVIVQVRPASEREVDDLDRMLRALQRLLKQGEREVRATGEPSAGWASELDGIARRLPPAPGSELDVPYRTAYRELEAAISELRDAPDASSGEQTSVPDDWTQRIAVAQAQLDEADRQLVRARASARASR